MGRQTLVLVLIVAVFSSGVAGGQHLRHVGTSVSPDDSEVPEEVLDIKAMEASVLPKDPVTVDAPVVMSGKYVFPTEKLTPPQNGKPYVILLAGGSLNPMTKMHVKLLEVTREHYLKQGLVVGGAYFSPVNNFYSKSSLKGHQYLERYTIASLLAEDYDWLMIDPYGGYQKEFLDTYFELQHTLAEVKAYIAKEFAGYDVDVKIRFVGGADLVKSVADLKSKWNLEQIWEMTNKPYGWSVVPRTASEKESFDDSLRDISDFVERYQTEGEALVKEWRQLNGEEATKKDIHPLFGKEVEVIHAEIPADMSFLSSTLFREKLADGAPMEELLTFSNEQAILYMQEHHIHGAHLGKP